MPLIRPRLTDWHGISVAQHDIDFAIPFLDEDIPLYVDPFLLWRSPSFQDKGLHQMLLGAFNNLGILAKSGAYSQAIGQLIASSECDEVGLGTSASRAGHRIGESRARDILSLFERIPYYRDHGFRHLEEIQLFVDGVSRDRISDFSCSFLKSFLIDYTHQQCQEIGIPVSTVRVPTVYDPNKREFVDVNAEVPVHPNTGKPLLFVPKRWLRYVPWISYDGYFREACPQDEIAHAGEELTQVKVLTYNRENFGVVDAYIREKERTADDCKTDLLFSQIPVLSARRKMDEITRLPTGKGDNADRKYEKAVGSLLPTLLYPYLDFAAEQSRTESGVSIRDLIFYNTRSHDFLKELMADYNSRQITFELKNVAAINREHVDQLNRYLHDTLGNFGVFVTRHPLRKAERTRTIDLWAGQRKAVVVLSDEDLRQMVEVYDSKQRHPIDVLIRSYVQFRRACPG
ncbi:MAG: hypothetical protein EOR86_04950 [Mesorhizobium sp.]|uniref:hypothetical protein n=1 Tax=Mesorhizobium sp. TaxID=1871066 RepID=UPI000FE4E408|nr:hypothetical protein [Mesorhizobium sp.]RWM98974.1 MAG: hypothetical protein EOR86_04950 [Mesorhizobium sp.]